MNNIISLLKFFLITTILVLKQIIAILSKHNLPSNHQFSYNILQSSCSIINYCFALYKFHKVYYLNIINFELCFKVSSDNFFSYIL